MVSAQVTSMLVMGTLVAIVVAAVARSRPWYHHSPQSTGDTEEGWSPDRPAQQSLFERTGVWIGAFLLLAVGAVAGVAYFVTNPAAPTGLTSGPILIGSLLFVGVYVLLGVYATAKQRGHPTSLAAAETVTVFGALFLAAVAAQLIGA